MESSRKNLGVLILMVAILSVSVNGDCATDCYKNCDDPNYGCMIECVMGCREPSPAPVAPSPSPSPSIAVDEFEGGQDAWKY